MMWRGTVPSTLTSLGRSMSIEDPSPQLGFLPVLTSNILTTETPNPQTRDIDTLSTLEMVQRINQ